MSNNVTENIVAAQDKVILAQDKIIKLYQHYTVAPMTSTYKLIEAANIEVTAAKQELDNMLSLSSNPQ